MEEGAPTPVRKVRSSKRRVIIVIVVGLILTAAVSALLLFRAREAERVAIPATIKQRLTFPAYLPSKLPGEYRLAASSFTIQEGAVLIFKASDNVGTIAFTEQAKPSKFDFEEFYQQQLTEAQNVADVPYPSTAGKSLDGKTKVLSVVTDRTWIFISTHAPISNDDWQQIVRELHQQ